MGCTASFYNTRNSCTAVSFSASASVCETIPAKIDFRPEEINILLQTWPIASKDIKETGLQVFLKLFELCPSIKKLFSIENVPSSMLAKNVFIKAHGTRVMTTLATVIDGLQDIERNNNSLRRLLFVLGQQHKRLDGFRREYFEIFYESLMWQWGRCLGYAFTPDVADTWSHLFVFIIDILEKGCNSTDVM